MTLEQILHTEESSTFDRKSIRIEPKSLAQTMVAMANSDGGVIVVGLTDAHKKIEGIDYDPKRLNDLLRTPVDFCIPSVPVRTERVECIDVEGRPNHLLVFHIDASMRLHTTQADEAFIRVGDKSRKLAFDDRLQLMYDKGLIHYEETAVDTAVVDDLDFAAVEDYCRQIGYGKTVEEFLQEEPGFLAGKKGQMRPTVAAILLFGKNPQKFFPRAQVRFIRYDGTEEKTGAEMNVIKDVTFTGTVRQQIDKAVEFLGTQISEHTYLGSKGLFVTDDEYPLFVRQEIIVNAVCHRDYAIYGTEIQVKMFTNRLVVESPGSLPGRVRPDNIRHTHFSRNPKIAQYLKAYRYVKEFGEGVDRMCRELEARDCGDVRFQHLGFILKATVMNKDGIKGNKVLNLSAKSAIHAEIGDSATEKSAIHAEIGDSAIEKSAIQTEINGIRIERFNSDHADYSNKSATLAMLDDLMDRRGFTQKMKSNLYKFVATVADNEIFGAREVQAVLNCTPSTARLHLSKLRELEIISPVKGKGKGQYMFKDTSES